jgi:uncharacterized membrane protein
MALSNNNENWQYGLVRMSLAEQKKSVYPSVKFYKNNLEASLMTFAILSHGGVMYLLRWIHFLAGVTWIGLLYYFNFVQGSFFAETDAATKSNATQKLVPRALWWFRWAAMFTFLSGVIYIGMMPQNFHSSWGVSIGTGAVLGIIMFLNVWLIIWPNQKVVIQNATQVASGGQAIPTAAACGARALVASRTNTLFSLPMLFFMGASQHLGIQVSPDANLLPLVGALAIIIGALEINAIKGKTGPLTSVKGVIHCGLALTVVLYILVEVLTK